MGPKKKVGKVGKKGKKGKKDAGLEGPTPAELLAQIAVLNVAKDKEMQERNFMMLERVRNSFFLPFIIFFFLQDFELANLENYHLENGLFIILWLYNFYIQWCSLHTKT